MSEHRPVLKVCGLTRVADIRGAEAAGADFCGFITEIERSPRCLTRQQAVLLARSCRARPVLVVESMAPEDVAKIASATGAHAVQLHGGDADYVRKVAEAIVGTAFLWRPIGVPERAEDREALVAEVLAEIEAAVDAGAAAVLLDTRTSEGSGGSGRTCDWEAAAEIVAASPCPVLIAGGLGPENLGEALEVTGAAGADLSSSLETVPGCKCPMRLRQLGKAWR